MTVQLAPDVHWLHNCTEIADRHMHLSTYLIEGADGNVLVDTGANLHSEAIAAEATALTDGEGIDTIVLTHSTLEHTGNVGAFQERWPDTEVIASTAAPEVMGTPTATEWKLGQTVEIAGEELSFLPPVLTDNLFTVWVFHPRSGVLFTSEAFGRYHTPQHCADSPRGVAEDPDAFGNVFKYCADRLEFLKFVERERLSGKTDRLFEGREIDLLAPAHGNPLPVADLDAYWAVVDDVITALSYSDTRLAQVEHDRD